MIAVLAVAFLTELAALGILAAWGWQFGASPVVRTLLAVGLPGAFGLVWGVLLAPRARVPLPLPAVLAGKTVLFALAAAALWRLSGPLWGLGFFVLAALAAFLGDL